MEKITGAVLFAPSKKYIITDLNYTGNSTFEVENLQYNGSTWGDPRYRIRLYLEDGSMATYGYMKGMMIVIHPVILNCFQQPISMIGLKRLMKLSIREMSLNCLRKEEGRGMIWHRLI